MYKKILFISNQTNSTVYFKVLFQARYDFDTTISILILILHAAWLGSKFCPWNTNFQYGEDRVQHVRHPFLILVVFIRPDNKHEQLHDVFFYRKWFMKFIIW